MPDHLHLIGWKTDQPATFYATVPVNAPYRDHIPDDVLASVDTIKVVPCAKDHGKRRIPTFIAR